MNETLYPWAEAMLQIIRTVDPTASVSDLVTDGLPLTNMEAMQMVSAFKMNGYEVIAHFDSSGCYIPSAPGLRFGLALDFDDGEILARFYED